MPLVFLSAEATPPDPSLRDVGDPRPGQTFRFVLRGTPGANARIYLGRAPLVRSMPGVEVEQLVTHDRTDARGTSPPTGLLSYNLLLPTYLPPGFSFFAQAETVDPGGDVRRTNSVPVVVR